MFFLLCTNHNLLSLNDAINITIGKSNVIESFNRFYWEAVRKYAYEHICKLCVGLSQGAVSLVLDSLDDIHCLQEAPLNDRDFLHSVLEDRQLHALLEVSTYYSVYFLCIAFSANCCSNSWLYLNTMQVFSFSIKPPI
jgi:L27 domain.